MSANLNDIDILTRLETEIDSMSKSHKKIAEYIISNYDRATFMTASTLGENVGVSESTVVRFATRLGFEGFPQLQRALQDVVKTKLTILQRVDLSNEMLKKGDILENVMNLDISKIRSTLETVNRDEFKKAVDAISEADNIFILGTRSSFALSQFLSFYLNYQ